jgi:hypothetical protein
MQAISAHRFHGITRMKVISTKKACISRTAKLRAPFMGTRITHYTSIDCCAGHLEKRRLAYHNQSTTREEDL